MTSVTCRPGGAPGRSRTVRHGDTVYTVASARTLSAPFADQAAESPALLVTHVAAAAED